MIKDDLRTVRIALEAATRELDERTCSRRDAIELLETLSAMRWLADGMLHALEARSAPTQAAAPNQRPDPDCRP